MGDVRGLIHSRASFFLRILSFCFFAPPRLLSPFGHSPSDAKPRQQGFAANRRMFWDYSCTAYTAQYYTHISLIKRFLCGLQSKKQGLENENTNRIVQKAQVFFALLTHNKCSNPYFFISERLFDCILRCVSCGAGQIYAKCVTLDGWWMGDG